ncbi:MAG: hypothetical protein GX442_16875 [Candidatus Riflebacteria bacterium]|nr:hypothetical protein [Candidatus Riflebacteria bacterium]
MILNTEERRWPTVIFILVLLFLVYNFLNTIFRSDIKRFAHDRIYVDYATYKKPRAGTADSSPGYSPVFSSRVSEAKRTLNEGRVEAAMGAYTSHMADRMSRMPADLVPIKPRRVPEFEEMRTLAAVDIPEVSEAKAYFAAGRYDAVISTIHEVLNNLPENDLHHRSQLYDTLAESYFMLKDRDGYITNKVKFVQCMRRVRAAAQKAYPAMNADSIGAWISAEEATRQLLRIRTTIGGAPDTPQKAAMLLRAELDAEVARALN